MPFSKCADFTIALVNPACQISRSRSNAYSVQGGHVFRTNDRTLIIRNALLLGAMSSAFLLSVQGGDANFSTPVPLLPLFIAALCFGARGALYAALAGIVPPLLLGQDYPGAFRIAFLTLSVGVIRSIQPRIPGYISVLVLWLGLVLPLRSTFFPSGEYRLGALATQFWEHHVLLSCFTDVLMALVAGAFVLNPSIWCLLTRKPHTPNIITSSIHVVTLTALLSILGVIATFSRLGVFSQNRFADSNLWTAFGLFATFVVLPTLVGIRFSLLSERFGISPLKERSLTSSKLPTEGVGGWLDSIPDELFDELGGNAIELGADANKLGVCAIDEQGTIIFMNDQFRAASNIAFPGTNGRSFAQLARDCELLGEISRLLNSTPPDRDLTTECRIGDRETNARFYQVSLRKREEGTRDVSNESQSPRVITLLDITHRRTIERRQLDLQRLESLASFITSSTQTIGDCCASIVGRASCAEVLSTELSKDAESLRDTMHEISFVAQNVGRIASQIAEFAGSSTNQIKATLDIRAIIRDNINVLQNTAGEKVPVVLETQANEGFSRVDPQLLMQALVVLITNARNSCLEAPAPIKITVLCEEIDQVVAHLHPGTQPGRFVRVRVSDQGVGMTKEALARATGSTCTDTGAEHSPPLGLASVSAIVRSLDGFMTIESKLRVGTTVSLYFPLLDPPEIIGSRFDAESEGPHEIALGESSIIVAETSDSLREVLCDMVSSLGYRVTGCKNPEEMKAALYASPCNTILIDEKISNLPDSDILAFIKNDFEGVKTVVMSSALILASHRSDGVIQKPFDIGRLSHALTVMGSSKHPLQHSNDSTSQEFQGD